MSKKTIKIQLTNQDETSTYDLDFEMDNTSIADKWLEEAKEFIDNGQPFDDRERFYNFPHSKYTAEYVVDYLNKLIDTINSYAPGMIEKRATIFMPQDTLNYLHHIFEVNHGLYDQQQDNEFFSNAPQSVRQALADLNIWIHRFESLGEMPRFVGTWYGKPCRKELSDEDFKQFSMIESWGDLKINYCEIGKTLFDLYHDNDQYIDKDAFKPLRHYSVDFTVRFTEQPAYQWAEEEARVWEYYHKHEKFFKELGYTIGDNKLSLGWITVGRIKTDSPRDEVIEQIGRHQRIGKIIL